MFMYLFFLYTLLIILMLLKLFYASVDYKNIIIEQHSCESKMWKTEEYVSATVDKKWFADGIKQSI